MPPKKPIARPFLNRYTSLPVLLDILFHTRIVLLSPTTWEDRNDSHYLERYKAQKNLKTLVALCFSNSRETFHHWKVFSSGSAGVCVEFDKEKLLSKVHGTQGFSIGPVEYLLIKQVERKPPELSRWPFIKRVPFRDEREFRIIYEDSKKEESTKEVPIGISCINKVTLSPWIPRSIAVTVSKVIAKINGCDTLRVERSSLLDTPAWKLAIKPQKPSSR